MLNLTPWDLAHGLGAVVASIAVFLMVRSVYRTSARLGWLVAVVVLARALLSIVFFLVSSWDLPILESQHTGDGYWVMGSDSRLYYPLAERASLEGLDEIPSGSASPAYTATLAMWFWFVGPSLLAGALLNEALYAAMVGALARWQRATTRPLSEASVWLIALPLSLSPTLTLCSAQVLKDVFFAGLLVGAALVTRAWLPRFNALVSTGQAAGPALYGLLGLAVTTLIVSGVRPYYGVFIGLALAVAFVVQASLVRPVRLVRRALAAGLVLAVHWFAFATGAGAYYEPYHEVLMNSSRRVLDVLDDAVPLPTFSQGSDADGDERSVVDALDSARRGFVSSGGNSNLAKLPATPRLSSGEAADEDSSLHRGESRLRSTLVGLSVIFLPLSLLQSAGVVQTGTGTAAMLLADVDTLFALSSFVLLASYFWRRRRSIVVDLPCAAFLATAAAIGIVLLAYVVTNVGTLTRLRIPAFVFLWLLPIAFSMRAPTSAVSREPS